jgi:hypothetical protein
MSEKDAREPIAKLEAKLSDEEKQTKTKIEEFVKEYTERTKESEDRHPVGQTSNVFHPARAQHPALYVNSDPDPSWAILPIRVLFLSPLTPAGRAPPWPGLPR